MLKREVVKLAMDGERPPYVPWHCSFTFEAQEKLIRHFHTRDLDESLGNHFLELGNGIGFFDDIGDCHFKDVFGVVWNRTVDKDIGVVVPPCCRNRL